MVVLVFADFHFSGSILPKITKESCTSGLLLQLAWEKIQNPCSSNCRMLRPNCPWYFFHSLFFVFLTNWKKMFSFSSSYGLSFASSVSCFCPSILSQKATFFQLIFCFFPETFNGYHFWSRICFYLWLGVNLESTCGKNKNWEETNIQIQIYISN